MNEKNNLFNNIVYTSVGSYDNYNDSNNHNFYYAYNDYSSDYSYNLHQIDRCSYFLKIHDTYIKMKFISYSRNPTYSLYETMIHSLNEYNGIDYSNNNGITKYNHYCKYDDVILIFSALFSKKLYSNMFGITCILKNGSIYNFSLTNDDNTLNLLMDFIKFDNKDDKNKFKNILCVQTYNEVEYVNDINNANKISHFNYKHILTFDNGISAYFKFNHEWSKKMSLILFSYNVLFIKDSVIYKCKTLDELSYLLTTAYKAFNKKFDIKSMLKDGTVQFQNHNILQIKWKDEIFYQKDHNTGICNYVTSSIFKLINNEWCYIPSFLSQYNDEYEKLTDHVESFKRLVEKIIQ